jgi:purine-binding chemotaxis protein CheW
MTEMHEGISEQEEDTQKGKYLTFTVGKEVYGLEIKFVTEIIGIQEITQVPELPEYVKGIINLRGKIIPVMDVRLKFKKELRQYDDRTCIVVIDINGSPIGLIVDRVSEVLSIPEQDIVPLPEIERGAKQKYVNGIGKVGNDVKLLLDCEKLLKEDEMPDMDIINSK